MLDPQPTNLRLTRWGLTNFAATILLIAAACAFAPWTISTLLAQQVTERAARNELTEYVGRKIDDFRLQDFRGASHALGEINQEHLVVVAFIGTECPLAKVYGTQLANCSKRYARSGVSFIAIDSNLQDTPTELGHFARRHGIEFPVLKDPGNRVADQFRAERTPEVFLLDRDRIVRYRGRIDDQFGVGYARPKSTANYLLDAIDELLAGQDVSVPETKPVGCHIGRVHRGEPKGKVTYTNQISRIMQQRCVECHREEGIAPFALQSYDDVAAWAETICEVVQDLRMPPWHANPEHGQFANEATMSRAEKELLCKWLDNGVPRGDPADLPEPIEFVDGWILGKPDLVLSIPKPITVPATGVVNYQYATIDPGFTEGKWIRASEVRPGVRSVVHHILVFIHPPGGDPVMKQFGIGFESLGSYVPGAPPMNLSDGVARYAPAGSTLTFQIHYTPDGIERQDRSRIGLYFADSDSVKYTMQSIVAANLDLRIPAGDANFRSEAAHRVSHDMELHSLTPHMHYRGKSFRFEATYPNGSREILLDVPNYDFNWQNTYRLAEPKFVPEGTLIRCVAFFDNSENNLANPDPSVVVGWGEQTWQEMMIGFAEGVFLNQDMTLPELPIRSMGDGRYRVRFSFKPDRTIRTLNVAGTFNDWSTVTHPLTDSDGDGIFTADVEVLGGEHRYKFVIDGKYWSHDPASRILTGFFHESFFDTRQVATSRQP